MSYEILRPAERRFLDLLMAGKRKEIGRLLKISPDTQKHYITIIGAKYGICTDRYSAAVRICYLRGKELGLIS